MRELKNYEFYYYFKDGGKKYTLEIKPCKQPKKTNVYKQLLNNLDRGFIEVFGYQVISNNIKNK